MLTAAPPSSPWTTDVIGSGLFALAVVILVVRWYRRRGRKAETEAVADQAAPVRPLRFDPIAFDPAAERSRRAEEPREDRFDRGPVLADGLMRRLVIDYADAGGARSRRVVVIRRLHGWAPEAIDYLLCFCELRRALRTFRADRIEAVYDPSTGEDMGAPARYLASLVGRSSPASAATAKPPETGAPAGGRTGEILIERGAGVVMLVALARADGRFDRREKDVIATFLELLHPGDALDRDILWPALQVMRPGEAEREAAVAVLSSWAETDLQAFFEAASTIVEAVKGISPEESALLREMFAKFEDRGISINLEART